MNQLLRLLAVSVALLPAAALAADLRVTVEGMRARIARLYHEVLLEFTAVSADGSIAQARPAERQRELVR